MIINPLVQIVIYAMILSGILSARLQGIDNKYAYAIYLSAGTLAWSLFSEVISRCLNIFIDNGNLLKKLVFPKICLPLIVSGSALVNNILLFVSVVVIFALLGHMPTLGLLWLPLLMAVTMALALGLGLILGVLNVFIRDTGQVVPVILQVWFWFTPIVYMPTIIPEVFRKWLAFNPMYHIVKAYQDIMVFGLSPHLAGVAGVSVFALLLLAFAFRLVRKANADIVDVI
jgi:lipopolysaccharide transport system permease protein